MNLLLDNFIDILEYKIKQAEHFETYHYCEVCKAFSAKRPCKYGHSGRYWALRHFKTLHHKLTRAESLLVRDLILMEVIDS